MSKLEVLKAELANLQNMYDFALDELVKLSEWKNKAKEVITYLMETRGKVFFTDEELDKEYGMKGEVKRLLSDDCMVGIQEKRIAELAELKEENRQLKNEVEDLTGYCNQIGKIKTGVLKLFEHIVAR